MGSNFPMRNESMNEMIHHFVVTLYEYNHNCKVVQTDIISRTLNTRGNVGRLKCSKCTKIANL